MGKKSKQKSKVASRPPVGPLDIVCSLLPVVFVAGIRSFAGPCMHEDGSVSACATAGHVLFGLGVVALLLALLRLMSADLRTRRSFDLFLVIAGALMALLPGNVLALCMMETMRCRAVMLPFARIVGAALAICGLACELSVDHEVPTGRKRR